MTTPIQLEQNRETTLAYAYASYLSDVSKGLAELIARKAEEFHFYDILGIDRVVAICHWGSSGSYLLASYLDRHHDIIMMPQSRSQWICPFLETYSSLPLREKLIVYPDFSKQRRFQNGFFDCEFPVSEMDYCATVAALADAFDDLPSEFLNSRRGFFVLLHVAYSIATGHRPATPRPLIVYALHLKNDSFARQLVHDFPDARFIHTVRDPISVVDSWFAQQIRNSMRHGDPALFLINYLIRSGNSHTGMTSCSIAVRFEDLHLRTTETMRRVADWLGLSWADSLLCSTFDGIEWIVRKGEVTWSGARPEQVRRHWRNLFPADRAMIFALFRENFAQWGYPSPAMFAHRWVRALSVAWCCLLPMKMELITIAAVTRTVVFPALRRGKFRYAAGSICRLGYARFAVRALLAAEIYRRLRRPVDILKLLE